MNVPVKGAILLPRVLFNGLSVRRQNLKMVKAMFHSRVAPDDLLFAGDFEQFHPISLGVVAGNDGVAVGQSLGAAGIIEEFFSQIFVRDAPNNRSTCVRLDDAVPIRAGDQGVATF